MRLSWLTAERKPEAAVVDAERPAAERPAFELAAVDLTTTDGRWGGWIATDGERTSDWLNHSSEILVHGMAELAPEADVADLGLPMAEGRPSRCIEPAQLIFLVPPPLPPNRHLRLHRRKVRIQLELGAYEVSGQLHIRPGAQAGDYVLRSSRSMVPLTEVELIHEGDPAFRRLLEVLIINTRHVTQMSESEARSAPAPAAASAPIPEAPPHRASAPVATSARAQALDGPADPMAALKLLLDEGLLTITEFQAKRAELRARAVR